jgi:hypothetical protein
MTLTAMNEAFHAAAAKLEDDVRKIDAGEIEATAEHRAFLTGAIKAWKRPAGVETGGYPVDPPPHPARRPARRPATPALSTERT